MGKGGVRQRRDKEDKGDWVSAHSAKQALHSPHSSPLDAFGSKLSLSDTVCDVSSTSRPQRTIRSRIVNGPDIVPTRRRHEIGRARMVMYENDAHLQVIFAVLELLGQLFDARSTLVLARDVNLWFGGRWGGRSGRDGHRCGRGGRGGGGEGRDRGGLRRCGHRDIGCGTLRLWCEETCIGVLE